MLLCAAYKGCSRWLAGWRPWLGLHGLHAADWRSREGRKG